MKALAWDIKGRTGILPDAGGQVIPHEFDYTAENQVVYAQNGVKIGRGPAIHGLDGSVSYRRAWTALCVWRRHPADTAEEAGAENAQERPPSLRGRGKVQLRFI